MTDTQYALVFCDEIRQEITGKHILIGVYGADLVPGVLPITFPLSLWLRITPMPVGDHKFTLTLVSPQGDEATIGGAFNFPEGDDFGAVIAAGALPMKVAAPGAIIARFSLDDGEPIEVGRLHVKPVGATSQQPRPQTE